MKILMKLKPIFFNDKQIVVKANQRFFIYRRVELGCYTFAPPKFPNSVATVKNSKVAETLNNTYIREAILNGNWFNEEILAELFSLSKTKKVKAGIKTISWSDNTLVNVTYGRIIQLR
jgi:hypothetical protein